MGTWRGFNSKTGEWQKDKAKNIKWVGGLSSQSYGDRWWPTGTVRRQLTTGRGCEALSGTVDLACCYVSTTRTASFSGSTRTKNCLPARARLAHAGRLPAPLVEDKRLWYVSNRGEVVCLDAEGF